MRIPIELPEPQADKLRGEAQRLGVRPEDLATAAVLDLLSREVGDFEPAARYVIQKNRELHLASRMTCLRSTGGGSRRARSGSLMPRSVIGRRGFAGSFSRTSVSRSQLLNSFP